MGYIKIDKGVSAFIFGLIIFLELIFLTLFKDINKNRNKNKNGHTKF